MNAKRNESDEVVGSTNFPGGYGYPGVSPRNRSSRIRMDVDYIYGPAPEGQNDDINDPANYPIHVSVYDLTREYGGPEEGGWYYDSYEFIESTPVERPEDLKAAVDKMAAQFSRASFDGKIVIMAERTPGEQATKARPHYESSRGSAKSVIDSIVK